MRDTLAGILFIIGISFIITITYSCIEIYIKDYLEERKRIKEQEEYERYWERYKEYKRKLDRAGKKDKIK